MALAGWPLLRSECVCNACMCYALRARTERLQLQMPGSPRQGTSARRRRGMIRAPCLRACVRDQGAAGRPARGGPGWALGVGGCILAGREAVDHARAAAVVRGSVLYSMANADCRELKKRQQQANPSMSQVTYTAAAACLSTRKRQAAMA